MAGRSTRWAISESERHHPTASQGDAADPLWRNTSMSRRGPILLAAVSLALALGADALASCLPVTPAQQRARADVIFNGVALSGPTSTGIQRFRVTRYVKGRGPAVVRVSTGNIRRADGTGTITSVSLDVRRGERWRIFAHGSASKVLKSSVCDGSRKLE